MGIYIHIYMILCVHRKTHTGAMTVYRERVTHTIMSYTDGLYRATAALLRLANLDTTCL